MASLRIASFNCKGLHSAKCEINCLCKSHDVVCVQEHWLLPDNIHNLNDIHPDFNGIGVSAVSPQEKILTGRPYGGVGIIWHKKLDNFVTTVDTYLNWMACIRIKTDNTVYCIVTVYLPYEKYDNLDMYIECLASIESFISECESSVVYVLGDFNCNIQKDTIFSPYLENLIERTNCILSDYQFIQEGHTFVSDAWGTSLWLDHCLTTEDAHKAVTQISIMYDMVSSDHKPISLNVSVINMPQCSLDTGTNDDENCSRSVKWGSVDRNSVLLYHNNTRNLLGRLYESVSLQDVCLNPNCHDKSHTVNQFNLAAIKVSLLKAVNIRH